MLILMFSLYVASTACLSIPGSGISHGSPPGFFFFPKSFNFNCFLTQYKSTKRLSRLGYKALRGKKKNVCDFRLGLELFDLQKMYPSSPSLTLGIWNWTRKAKPIILISTDKSPAGWGPVTQRGGGGGSTQRSQICMTTSLDPQRTKVREPLVPQQHVTFV